MKNVEEVKLNWLEKQAVKFEEGRFAMMTILLTAQSCWGSVAAMRALQIDSVLLLSCTAAVTMASNSLFIAQSPGKWCLAGFYISVFVNLIIFLITLF